VSLILDALRRRSADRGNDGEAPDGSARPDAVLATLGYPRSNRPSGVPLKTLLLAGAAALMLGFLALTVLIAMLLPSAPPKPGPSRSAAAVPRPSINPGARGTAGTSGALLPGAPPVLPGAGPTGPASQMPSIASPATEPPVVTRGQASVPIAPTVPSPPPAADRIVPALQAAPRAAIVRRPAAPEPAPEPAPPQTSPAPREDHFGLALYYQRIGDFDSAIAHYRALLEQNDASAEVHNNLGLLYEEHGQRDDAITQFQRAIAIDPNYVKAHNNLGVSLMRASQPVAAASEFRVALGSDPRNVESLVNLALLQKAAGRIADARDLLRRALAIDPRNAGSHYNLAVVDDEGGNAAAAIEHYRAFLRFGSVAHADLVVRVRARLTTLGG
jgi:Tfp pilus assembly protein PilF